MLMLYLITTIVIYFTNYRGVNFGSMEFLSVPINDILMPQLMIGGLGAIMDIAITISSSISELIEKNKQITVSSLKKSGKEIGKDIFSTMINVLFFTYLCSGLPNFVLAIRNGFTLINYIVTYSSLELMRFLVSSIGIISYIILFFVVGKNIKTINSFKAIIISLGIIAIFILLISHLTNIGGFGIESYEEINMFSYDININMLDITISLILIGLIGAIIDSSIAISSALYELYNNSKSLTEKELYKSGLNIGKDILGTTINILLFAFLGESMTLLIWFSSSKYGISDIINSKIFCSEFIKIIFIGIGSILVIPITAKVMANKLIKNNYFNQ